MAKLLKDFFRPRLHFLLFEESFSIAPTLPGNKKGALRLLTYLIMSNWRNTPVNASTERSTCSLVCVAMRA